MIGPSRPSEPPVEMTAIDETPRAIAGRTRTVRRPSETASIIWEMPLGPSRHEEIARSPPTRPPAAGRKMRRRPERLGAADDVRRVHEQPRQAVRQKSEDDRAQGPEQARERREEQELGVGVAPEETAETRRPRRRDGLRSAHSPSSSFARSVSSSTSSCPPKKKAWAQRAFRRRCCPPSARHRSHRRAFGRSGRAAGRTGNPGCR